eukprot:3842277-Alexandrium_andersonii.AAC.1
MPRRPAGRRPDSPRELLLRRWAPPPWGREIPGGGNPAGARGERAPGATSPILTCAAPRRA